MPANTAIYELCWNISLAESIEKSQQWVLSAMYKHGQGLVTMLWRILGNEQDVCDAYQQTFLNLAHWQGRQKPHHVQAYLYRAATNIAISMLRRRKTRWQLKQKVASADSAGHSIDYAHNLDTKLMQEKLRSAISKLPEYLRNVVVLHDLGELSYAQTAKIAGISTSTARVYRCKAISLLAVWMAKEKGQK